MIKDILKEKENMTTIEKDIADYFLKEGMHVEKQSAHFIAKQLYTHPSSITRFTQKLGYSGFKDFIEAFVSEIKYEQTHFQDVDPNYPFQQNDKNTVIASKIGQLYHEIIDDTLSLIKHDDLQNAINLLKDSDVIYVYSAGVQVDLAKTFKDKMLKIGKNVIVETRMNYLFYRANSTNEKCAFIIISYSGEIEIQLRGVHKLKERHIPILAITTYGENSLSKLADHVLYVSTREKLVDNLGNFSMNLSTLFLLDVLYVSVFNDDYFKNYKQKVETVKEYELHRRTNNPMIKE